MAKRRVPTPAKHQTRSKNRITLCFNDADYETLELQAKEALRPVATYAKLCVLHQMARVDSPPRASRR